MSFQYQKSYSTAFDRERKFSEGSRNQKESNTKILIIYKYIYI